MGLNPPLYRVTIGAGKETPVSVDFGATRADGNSIYARREGQVMTVEGEIAEELSKEAEAYRSTSAVAFNRGDVTAVEASLASIAVITVVVASDVAAAGEVVSALRRGSHLPTVMLGGPGAHELAEAGGSVLLPGSVDEAVALVEGVLARAVSRRPTGNL